MLKKVFNNINITLYLILITIFIGVINFDNNSTYRVKNYSDVSKFQYLDEKIFIDKNFSISFDFKIHKLNKEPDKIKYENIFQTANVNKGLRLEYFRLKGSKSNFAIFYTDKRYNLMGIDLGPLPSKDKWHRLKIYYSKIDKKIFVYLNNKKIITQGGIDAEFDFTNIVAGYGFSKERFFNGEIKNFKIKTLSTSDQKNYLIPYFIIFMFLITIRVFLQRKYKDIIKHINFKSDNILKYLISLFFLIISAFLIYKYSNTNFVDDYSNINKPIFVQNKINSDFKDISIKFDFYINKAKEKINGIQYENLFQTEDFNNGFRLEISKKTESESLWALVFTTDERINDIDEKMSNGLALINLGTIPTEEKWHTFELKYSKISNEVDVFVNGINASHEKKFRPLASFENIIVGKGFENRYFNGEIKNFIIDTSNMTYSYEYLALVLLIFSFFVFIILLSQGTGEYHIEKNSFNKKIICKKTIFFISSFIIILLLVFKAESFLVGENLVFRFIFIALIILSIFTIILITHNIKYKIIKFISQTFFYSFFYFYLLFYTASFMHMFSRNSIRDIRPTGLTIEEIAAIYQSSLIESIQFLVITSGYSYLFIMFIIPTILTIFLFYVMRYISPLNNTKKVFSYTLSIIVAFFLILPTIYSYPKALYGGFISYAQVADEVKNMVRIRKNIDIDLSVNNDLKGTHILVIGESANRDHMGSYGYFRKTTPWLTENIKASNTILFENSYSPFSHTIPSLMQSLTEANQYNRKKTAQAMSLIEIVNKAGFDTYWISEQTESFLDTPLSVIRNLAKQYKYVSEGGQVIEALKSTMQEINKSKNNLIVIHLMGSHFKYQDRYFTEYQDHFDSIKFEEIGNFSKEKKFVKNKLNTYDTSIKYTDKILKNIFNITALENNFVDSFIYFSDHGEDIYGKKYHNSSDFNYSMVRVPLFAYISDRYKEKFQKDYSLLKERKNYIYTNDLLYNTLLDIYKIKSSEFESGYSLLDKNYIINEDNALTMSASPDTSTTYYSLIEKKYIRDDPVYISKKNIKYLNKNYPNKILSVDNDLIAKAFHSNSYGFTGSEFNIALKEMKIGHYPNHVFNTSLEEYLGLDIIKNQTKLWFDIKTVRGMDIGYSISDFEKLDKRFNIKERALIESWENGLDQFSRKGWNTIFYIEGNNDTKTGKSDKSRNLNYAKEIAKKIIKNNINGISFWHYDYDFVKNNLESLLPERIDYHVFGFDYDYQVVNKNMISNVKSSKIFNDKRVKTILLDGPTRFNYW